MLVEVTREPIDPGRLLSGAHGPSDGAVLLFLGVVRDHNDGRPVEGLDYEAFEAMAERELAAILHEARARWDLGETRVVHRVGSLAIGETSVATVVCSSHRAEAYEASRWIMDEIKKRVPIWKRERYLDGSADWLGAAQVLEKEPVE